MNQSDPIAAPATTPDAATSAAPAAVDATPAAVDATPAAVDAAPAAVDAAPAAAPAAAPVAAAPAKTARIIVITSGKGGVGKTTTAASFSAGLALRGFKTAVIDRFHADGRPVFVYWGESELRQTYPSYTFGVLVRLLPRGGTPPPIAEVFTLNRELFEHFDLSYPLPGKSDQFATWVHRKYVGTWARLAEALQAAGLRAEAATAIELARALNPVP